MKNFSVTLYLLFPAIILVLLTPISSAQVTPSENRILLQIQKLLEYPQVLQGWTNMTNFCFLPPSPSLKILCTNGHVSEITIIGNKNSPSSEDQTSSTLSERFSMDSFFTVLTKLSNLKVLSLVSIGLWGPLPSKINRFLSLEVLDMSSNFIYGEIPSTISSLKNLRSLVLAYNLFNGSVPDLGRLDSLEELNLGGNKLGPDFPSLSKNLETIILSNNSFRFQIPPQLMQIHKLEHLDISSNEMFGNIPSFIFSLDSLQYLNLASNQLSGSLSVNASCSPSLTFIDISHNLLVGKLPSCIGSKSLNGTTILYYWNCLNISSSSDQYPSTYCKKGDALAVKPPVRREMQLGRILGTTAGGVVGIAGLVAFLILFNLRKSKAERVHNKRDRSIADKFYANDDARRALKKMRLAALGLPAYCIFTSEEIEDATNNFHPSNLIEGSQGQLFRGRLIDGTVVLINRVQLKQKRLLKDNMHNLEVLPNLRHRHLVSVLGHCVINYQDHPQTASSTIFIVFEHISNVSLRDHLTDRRKQEMLKWPERMAISIGIARGIQFLHTGVTPGIFGNNLKIQNILLDDNLNAKVSGYSIPLQSKKVHDSNTLDAESASNHIDSAKNAEKEDIYQLGVILLQVITGKLITHSSEVEQLKNELEKGLSEAASPAPRKATDHTYESLRTAVQITLNCLSRVSSNRPSVDDILWNLQYSMQVLEAKNSSGNLSPSL